MEGEEFFKCQKNPGWLRLINFLWCITHFEHTGTYQSFSMASENLDLIMCPIKSFDQHLFIVKIKTKAPKTGITLSI